MQAHGGDFSLREENSTGPHQTVRNLVGKIRIIVEATINPLSIRGNPLQYLVLDAELPW
jgi:hypothetical protein